MVGLIATTYALALQAACAGTMYHANETRSGKAYTVYPSHLLVARFGTRQFWRSRASFLKRKRNTGELKQTLTQRFTLSRIVRAFQTSIPSLSCKEYLS